MKTGENLLERGTKRIDIKGKSRQVGLHQTGNLLHIKETINRMKNNLQNGRKCLSIIHLKRGQYSKYKSNSYNSISKNKYYRRLFCVVWAQLPLRKASGERGPSTQDPRPWIGFPWGIRPSLYLGRFEICFLLKLPHPELRQQMFTAYL